MLQSQELNHFEPLRSSDFEVDHWLRHYAAQQMAAAGRAADPRCGAAQACVVATAPPAAPALTAWW